MAGLRYVSDAGPGIRRIRAGRGFTYRSPDGSRLTDRDTLARIRSLAIPPAWTDVWISPNARGHIQATGRDARGRKQYRYHPLWRAARDETKYHRMIAFGHALPRVRGRVEHDLALPGLPRDKVIAAVVRLLEATRIRVGNEEYAQQNRSFGLTTLRRRHVDVDGSEIRFAFRGKSGRQHRIDLRDRRLARIVRRCQDLPGQQLFQYRDDVGDWEAVDSDDVNEYLRDASGEEITAKDFRTWAGSLLAFQALCAIEPGTTQAAARHQVSDAIREVAEKLGNTPAVSRRSYVHPAVVDGYLDGTLASAMASAAETLRVVPEGDCGPAGDAGSGSVGDQVARATRRELERQEEPPPQGLRPEEEALLAFLERRAEQEREAARNERGAA